MVSQYYSGVVRLSARAAASAAATVAAAIVMAASVTGQTVPDRSYTVVGNAIAKPLTSTAGVASRGKRLVLSTDAGNCALCHELPVPEIAVFGTMGPSLVGVGSRLDAGALRLRIVDSRRINPRSAMPPYYRVRSLNRVMAQYRDRPVLDAQQIEDIIAYLQTLRAP